ncbi:hypothetical protein RchiOBHm_Chr4g0438781 [Rosa chinensis]|uniref:Uncharacterized protein n=1 Tax=Rosa chinensis TaxID=74649 RepID=A0A2P6R2U1_ROSCH|nr:hypothetical protein RchiOBHm_Chr4g0438781 [Rosa chinensis]
MFLGLNVGDVLERNFVGCVFLFVFEFVVSNFQSECMVHTLETNLIDGAIKQFEP